MDVGVHRFLSTSRAFSDFLALCLREEDYNRPTAKELLQTAFVRSAKRLPADFVSMATELDAGSASRKARGGDALSGETSPLNTDSTSTPDIGPVVHVHTGVASPHSTVAATSSDSASVAAHDTHTKVCVTPHGGDNSETSPETSISHPDTTSSINPDTTVSDESEHRRRLNPDTTTIADVDVAVPPLPQEPSEHTGQVGQPHLKSADESDDQIADMVGSGGTYFRWPAWNFASVCHLLCQRKR